jgi:hypothetical protein
MPSVSTSLVLARPGTPISSAWPPDRPYHDSPIRRLPLVKLFASVLRHENGEYWLVTPVERGRIEVEDAPFVAVEVKAEGEGEAQSLSFRTNLDEWVTAGPDHPIRVAFAAGTGEPSPYIQVKGGLEALLARPVFYELAERAVKPWRPDGGVEPPDLLPAGPGVTEPDPSAPADLERLRRYRPRLSRGDHDLNPDLKPLAALRPAAVLVPIVGGRRATPSC